MRTQRVYLFLLLLASMMVTSCAQLNMQPPQVTIKAIRTAAPLNVNSLTGGNLDLTFLIDLQLNNPNQVPMPIRGIAYGLSLNGAKLLQGVSSEIPTIPAYGSQTTTLTLSTNLISAPKFLFNLMKNPSENLDYELSGKIDLANFLPSFNFNESGQIPLTVAR